MRGDAVMRAGHLSWAQVVVRAQPDEKSPRKAVLTQFYADFRPRIVLSIGSRYDAAGQPAWYRISLPGRPNGRTGWVPAESLEVEPIRQEIVIDRSERRLELRVRGRVELRTRVAVGAPGMPTPLGLFYVVAKYKPANPFLGAYAIETSAYSSLSDWPGGGIVGIHGTNTPATVLGRAVSHGCVRVANEQILRLGRLAPIGTPIRIVA
ncbi:MAG: L,D-transpeptidase [Actinobacteria bacterium]|nr:L,D-transpeptidase [Actinomycetota bacterium]